MKKFIAFAALGLFIFSTPAITEAVELQSNETQIEVGGALISKGEAKSFLSADAHAKSGYELAITHALTDKLLVRYNLGSFRSEDKEMLGMVSYSKTKLNDFNFIYKASDNFDIIAGYENNKFTFGQAVEPATKASFHFGFDIHKKLNDKTLLYAAYIKGRDSSLSNIGIKYDFTKNNMLSLSYSKRKINDVDLNINNFNIHTKADYTLSGLLLMYGMKI